MEKTYTVKEIADILGYSTNSIYTFLKEGRIKGVRVGLGRFRISQQELNRILHLSKTSTTAPVVSPSVELHHSGENHYSHTPSLFDWFIGAVSFLLGFSLVLYSTLFDTVQIQAFQPWLLPLQVSLMAGGWGVLISNIAHSTSSLWHRSFYALLIISYIILALIKWQLGDMEKMLLYSLIAAGTIINFFTRRHGSFSFLLFLMLYGLTTSFAQLLGFNFQLPDFLQFIKNDYRLYGGLWFVITVILAAIILWSYWRKNTVSHLILRLAAVISILAALWLANILSWQMSVVILVVGLTCLAVPTYERIRVWDKANRRLFFFITSGLILILTIALSIIWVTQNNIRDIAANEALRTTSVGENLVKTTLTASKNTIEQFSQNTLLINALTKKEKETLTNLNQGVVEATDNLLRVIILDPKGTVLSIYPYDASLQNTDLTFQEHIQKALATGRTQISNQFQSVRSDKQLMIVIVTPVFDNDKKIVGLISGMINLPLLNDKLQKLAAVYPGGYFRLIDQNAKFVIHSDRSKLNVKINSNNQLNNGLLGKSGITEEYNDNGIRMLTTYMPVKEAGWAIGIFVPLNQVLQPTRTISVALYLIVAVCANCLELCWSSNFFLTRRLFTSP